MTSQSNEERNRLRLQAWEQRNQETSHVKEQNSLNVHLFGQPYKTIKGDELSNRIQKMLGSYEDNTTAEPFCVPSSLNFPLSNLIHPTSEPLSQQECHKSQSKKGPSAGPHSADTLNSPKHHCEEEAQGSSDLIQTSLRKTSHSDNINERQFTTFDRFQHHSASLQTEICSKDTASPLNRTMTMLHSQAFHPPLSYKQPSAAMPQKPTAYVRPMDGLDQVLSGSPELKPSPERHSPPDTGTLQKTNQEKASVLPQFLETKTDKLQLVEGILREMTCLWPPLLSGIHSPPKPQSYDKEINPLKQEEPSHPHQSSVAASSVCSSDSESSSKSEIGADDPPVSSGSFKNEPTPASVESGDWQLGKLMQFKQQNYRSKGQWGQRSPTLLSKTGPKQPTVSVFSPARDAHPKTVHFNASQKPPETPEASDVMKPTRESRNGSVSVHFNRTSPKQEEESRLKDRPKVKRENRRSKKCEITTNQHKNEEKDEPVQHEPCKSTSTVYPDHGSPSCNCGKPKVEARHKKASKSSQEDKSTNGSFQSVNKDTKSLVVKINLDLLSRIPGTSDSLETNVVQHCTKEEKPRTVKNCRKNDKEDQTCPKKKPKLQSHNSTLHTTRPEKPTPSETKDKRTKKSEKSDETPHLSPTLPQKSKKRKQCHNNAPQLNKEPEKCQNDLKKNSGVNMEKSTVQKLLKESSSERPLLKFEDRHYPVKYYIKEAKRLKHKADAETDKLCKTFHYLDAAMFFIESGIAMERDPQISMSSYTMFAETVELIKFVLKLSHSEAPSAAENDIIALCLRCQALLQMAMFHHKQKTALAYSKTLLDHFNTSSQAAPDPSAFLKGKHNLKSPCSSAASSSGSSIVPQDIGHVALTYVNITTLFLNAHDLWEQAEEVVKKGSGLAPELDRVMGRLSLTSSMRSMVCYIKQGLHWLQNGPKVK